MNKTGNTTPREDEIRREVDMLSIGVTVNKKQFFNKHENGTSICRSSDGVEVISRKCILIKHSSFPDESWAIFSESNYFQLQIGLDIESICS